MLQVQIQHELGRLETSIDQYVRVNGKMTGLQALAKNMVKLGFFLQEEMKKLAPPASEIADVAKIVEQHGGYIVRKSIAASVFKRVEVKGKSGRTMKSSVSIYNAREVMVEKEVKARQNAIGFLARSARISTQSANSLTGSARSRAGKDLSRVRTDLDGETATMTMNWGQTISTLSGFAAEGLSDPKGQQALRVALQRTVADMGVYIARKQQEAIGNALGGKR